MDPCTRCGQPTTFWPSDVITGLCRSCRDADAAVELAKRMAAESEAAEAVHAQQRALQTLVVGGRKVKCPICGHDRFLKSERLLNSRGATLLEVDWLNAGALTCACRRCGHVLWFSHDAMGLDPAVEE